MTDQLEADWFAGDGSGVSGVLQPPSCCCVCCSCYVFGGAPTRCQGNQTEPDSPGTGTEPVRGPEPPRWPPLSPGPQTPLKTRCLDV